jgi:hypothetical protein
LLSRHAKFFRISCSGIHEKKFFRRSSPGLQRLTSANISCGHRKQAGDPEIGSVHSSVYGKAFQRRQQVLKLRLAHSPTQGPEPDKARKGRLNFHTKEVNSVFHFQHPPFFFPPLSNSASVDRQ